MTEPTFEDSENARSLRESRIAALRTAGKHDLAEHFENAYIYIQRARPDMPIAPAAIYSKMQELRMRLPRELAIASLPSQSGWTNSLPLSASAMDPELNNALGDLDAALAGGSCIDYVPAGTRDALMSFYIDEVLNELDMVAARNERGFLRGSSVAQNQSRFTAEEIHWILADLSGGRERCELAAQDLLAIRSQRRSPMDFMRTGRKRLETVRQEVLAEARQLKNDAARCALEARVLELEHGGASVESRTLRRGGVRLNTEASVLERVAELIEIRRLA